MSILDDFDVDPETKQALRVALERTRMSLGLTDDLADGIIARRDGFDPRKQPQRALMERTLRAPPAIASLPLVRRRGPKRAC
jgi:hypothetical protein